MPRADLRPEKRLSYVLCRTCRSSDSDPKSYWEWGSVKEFPQP